MNFQIVDKSVRDQRTWRKFPHNNSFLLQPLKDSNEFESGEALKLLGIHGYNTLWIVRG
jgi:hypothetical protein